MTEKLHWENSYPIAVICDVIGLARSSYYHQPACPDDEALKRAIPKVLAEFPTYGTRRVAAQLHRHPYKMQVNRKRVQRVMRQNRWLQPVKRQKVSTTQSQHTYPRYPNLVKEMVVEHPDQVWVSDITHIRLRQEFVYLAVIMDTFTRSVRGWELGRHLDQQLTLAALRIALQDRVPEIHHSDQGVQYAATEYVELLKVQGVQISMAAQGVPEENGYAKRLIRTIKEEEVDLSEYLDFADAYTQIGHFLEHVYQHKRIHSALGYLTPAEFEMAWRVAHVFGSLPSIG